MDPPADPTLAPGTVIGGDLEVVRTLGQGGMGVVYEVRQRSTGIARALKVMHPDLLDEPALRRRFRDEATLAGSIPSDHVVKVITAGVDEATSLPWILMELLQGETLAVHVQTRGAPPHTEAVAILAQIAHALGAAHRHDPVVVHRDLKPENVFLADVKRLEGGVSVKLLDFGIAKALDPTRRGGTASMSIGSPQWMAPEQLEEGATITPATDVWAFGLLAFYVFTGQSYWRAARAARVSRAAVLAEVIDGTNTPATTRAGAFSAAARLPRGFDAWFARATDPDPTKRFADANEAFAALDVTRSSVRVPRRVVWGLALAASAVLAMGVARVALRPHASVLHAHARVPTLVHPALPTAPPPRACPAGTVEIAGGTFIMGGAPGTRFANQLPPHAVTLSPFCIDRTEVTVARHRACVDAGACAAPVNPPTAGTTWQWTCNALQPDRGTHPINCVTWGDADAFCRWAHERLPTEAEWEFAARGREGRHYPWGDALPDRTRLNAAGPEWVGPDGGTYADDDGFRTSSPVGAFPAGATPEGVLDLAGNVAEWVADWAGPYASTAQHDPTGPSRGSARVARGGGWLDPPLSATWRDTDAPDYRGRSLGFRCARTLAAE